MIVDVVARVLVLVILELDANFSLDDIRNLLAHLQKRTRNTSILHRS